MKNNYNISNIIINSPWKLVNEILMYLIKPFVFIYLKFNGVKIGKNFKFYGFPKIYRYKNSDITIGNNFECRNWWFSNPLGINHPTIICTWEKDAVLRIGDDVGISGGSIVASSSVIIGDRVLIGANSTIIDTDFHPTVGLNKRYSKENIKSGSVIIGDNCFIGMNSIILKGVKIKNNSVIPAGEIVR